MKKQDLNNAIFLIIITLILLIGGALMVNYLYVYIGVAQLIVAGLLYATISKTNSNRIVTFMYIGMTILLVSAGYLLVTAFQ